MIRPDLTQHEALVALRLLDSVHAEATAEQQASESFQALETVARKLRNGLEADGVDPAFGYPEEPT